MNRNKNYELILAVLVRDAILFQEVMLRIQREIFDINEYNTFVLYLRNFFKENKRAPNLEEFQLFCGPLIFGQFQTFASDVFTSPVVVDREFARKAFYKNYQVQQMLSFLERSETQIEQDTLDLQKEMGTFRDMVRETTAGNRDYTEWINEDDFIKSYKKARDFRLVNLAHLAFKTLNRIMGGIAKRELLIFIAPPNRGKTLYLVNEFFNALFQGDKVLYVSMENQVDESVTSRLTDRVLLMPRAEQRLKEELCVKFLRRFKKYIKTPVLMYRPANTFSIEELDMWLEEYEMRTGEVFDTIIVDYLNKFEKKTIKGGQMFDAERILTDDLRSIAVKRDKRIITAAQTNRSGLVNREGKKTETTTEDMIQGGFGQYETADIVLGYSETPNEKQRGVGRVSILKVREDGGRGKEFLVTTAPWIGLLSDDVEKILPDVEMLKDPKAVFDDLPGLKTISAEPGPGEKKPRREPEVKKIKEAGAGMVKTEGIEI